MRRGRKLTRLGAAAVLGLIVALGAGCDKSKRFAAAYYTSAQTSRAGAASGMAGDWRAKNLKLDDCLDLAFEHLDKEGDAKSLVFAGAVLDFAELIEKDLPQQGEMELLWFRIGGLAGAAGEKAYNSGDIKAARSLVLAGPNRWKTEAYWQQHPNHDALASYVLFSNGEGAEALRRLRSRTVLDSAQEKAIEEIQAAMR